MNAELLLPLSGLAACSLSVTLAWFWQRRSGNAGWIDPLWAASLGCLALTYALALDGWLPRRLLVAALVGTWSLRLTLHLVARVRTEPEDGRYGALRARWGARFQPLLFAFYQAQAALAVLLSLPFLVLCRAEPAGWRVQDLGALLLWLAALVGEGLADRQLRAFRARPENKGRTCRAGLWGLSRHPNYFFEWLHWLVYPLLGLGLELGWTLWFAPALMLYLVLRVTGVPPTEEQALRSRGDDYRRYQRTTNAFFPGPRKSAPEPLVDPR